MHVKPCVVFLCMCLQAWQCVCAEAVQQAEHVVQHMLAGCPAGVLERMVAAGCNIAIIGRHQVHGACLHQHTVDDSSTPQPKAAAAILVPQATDMFALLPGWL